MTTDYSDDLDTPTEKDLDDLYGSKYLGATDLGDKKIRTRIAKVRKETLQQQGKEPRAKFVIYFTSLDKAMVLNATNKNVLVEALGRDPTKWSNAEVGLYTELTQFAGKPVKGLRIKVLSAPKAATKPAATPTARPAPKGGSEDPGFGMDDDSAGFDEAAE
jgi:hypothetical protein